MDTDGNTPGASGPPSPFEVRFEAPRPVYDYDEVLVVASIDYVGGPPPRHPVMAWWISKSLLGANDPRLVRLDSGPVQLIAVIVARDDGPFAVRLIVLDPHGPGGAPTVHDARGLLAVERAGGAEPPRERKDPNLNPPETGSA